MAKRNRDNGAFCGCPVASRRAGKACPRPGVPKPCQSLLGHRRGALPAPTRLAIGPKRWSGRACRPYGLEICEPASLSWADGSIGKLPIVLKAYFDRSGQEDADYMTSRSPAGAHGCLLNRPSANTQVSKNPRVKWGCRSGTPENYGKVFSQVSEYHVNLLDRRLPTTSDECIAQLSE